MPLKTEDLAYLTQLDLNFHCLKCGRCCRDVEGINIHDYEAEEIANYIQISKVEFIEKYTFRLNGALAIKTPCPFLKDDKCAIYDVRPDACRRYPFLSDLFIDNWLNGMFYIFTDCPGALLVSFIDRVRQYKLGLCGVEDVVSIGKRGEALGIMREGWETHLSHSLMEGDDDE